jgi:predicted site-specific integrase-resolvase
MVGRFMRVQRGPTPAASDLVPFKSVCGHMGIHWNTGYRYKRQGRFPLEVLEVGDRYYCRAADLEQYTHRAAS